MNLYAGDLEDENVVLEWIIDQKEDESIEEINREELFEYIETKEFLAVMFCKYGNIQDGIIVLRNLYKKSMAYPEVSKGGG